MVLTRHSTGVLRLQHVTVLRTRLLDLELLIDKLPMEAPPLPPGASQAELAVAAARTKYSQASHVTSCSTFGLS